MLSKLSNLSEDRLVLDFCGAPLRKLRSFNLRLDRPLSHSHFSQRARGTAMPYVALHECLVHVPLHLAKVGI